MKGSCTRVRAEKVVSIQGWLATLAHLEVRQEYKQPEEDPLRQGSIQQQLPQPHYHQRQFFL